MESDRVLANSGARVGDALVLTKPLGTGVIATALKRGLAAAEHVEYAIRSMLQLNQAACEIMLRFQPHGCTDVTGFGLLGHAREMALASKVTLELQPERIRLLDGALHYVSLGAVPGGGKNNRAFNAPTKWTWTPMPSRLPLPKGLFKHGERF